MNQEFSDTDRIQKIFEPLQKSISLDGRTPSINATTWFLGPKAENAQVLRDLISMAMEGQIGCRQDYMPGDPPIFNGKPDAESATIIKDELSKLIKALRGSIPLASYRNQSHMYWDLTLPAVSGYITAMLYNQNNVAAEASPVTTLLEIEACKDLCRMLGFPVEPGPGSKASWGHITCGGSIANGESMWAARNLKYLPLTMAAAIAREPALEKAKAVVVHTCRGNHARLVDLTAWELLNLPIDEATALLENITQQTPESLTEEEIRGYYDKYSVQNIGLARLAECFLENFNHTRPVILVPATAHYSWPKSAALIGLGTQAVKLVEVDSTGRMKMSALRAELDACLTKQQPVLQVVAVLGSTCEGSVDPLAEIIQIRREYQDLGMNFPVHVDAAWGGYFASILRAPPSDDRFQLPDRAEIIDHHPELYLSEHFSTHFHAIRHADTVTLDPHKSGFIPYPAGCLCYRNRNMRELIAFMSPVVSHGGVDETVGPYGIEGSKPGAAPAGIYLSHKVIPLNTDGYGRLLGRCLFNSKRFYSALTTINSEVSRSTGVSVNITLFQKLPMEQSGGTTEQIAEERQFIREHFVGNSTRALIEDVLGLNAVDSPTDAQKKALSLFQNLGSDLSIVSYAFNFVTADGVNDRIDLMNDLNKQIFRKLSLQPNKAGNLPDAEMFVTASEFDEETHGEALLNDFASRAGVERNNAEPIDFLISTTQNPWLSNTSEDNVMIGKLIDILRTTATEIATDIVNTTL